MKKRMIALALAMSCALSGVAAASVGTQSDPLISRDYLEGAFWNSIKESVTSGVTAALRVAYQAAEDKLNALGTELLSALGEATEDLLPEGWQSAESFTAQSGEREDTITLSLGSGLVWTSGSARTSAVMVDVTSGAEVPAGGSLTASHRYLAAEQTVVTVTSRTARWMAEGTWHTTADGISVVELPFTDVEEGWYYDAVCYVYDRELYRGVSATEFAPLTLMQRGMMTTVMHRLAGSPPVEYAPLFSDVPDGQWYSSGTVWAGQNNVVSGTDQGTFLPGNNVARQQIAVILYNYASRYMGRDVSARGDLTVFSDAGGIAGWASDALSWAVGVGIIQGSGGLVRANDGATRAEVAIMLQRFENWIQQG